MAIYKETTAENGVPLTYHRVASVCAIKGVSNVIEVASYISEAHRRVEEAALASSEPFNVYVDTKYHNAPYDPEMSLTAAYQWVKENVLSGTDILTVGNDPVAFALAKDADAGFDVPAEIADAVEAVSIAAVPEKQGFIIKRTVVPIGWRVQYEYEVDPNYVPSDEDGSFLKPFRYEPGMSVEAGMWYWQDDRELPHEAIASGVPSGFRDTAFFDFVD